MMHRTTEQLTPLMNSASILYNSSSSSNTSSQLTLPAFYTVCNVPPLSIPGIPVVGVVKHDCYFLANTFLHSSGSQTLDHRSRSAGFQYRQCRFQLSALGQGEGEIPPRRVPNRALGWMAQGVLNHCTKFLEGLKDWSPPPPMQNGMASMRQLDIALEVEGVSG